MSRNRAVYSEQELEVTLIKIEQCRKILLRIQSKELQLKNAKKNAIKLSAVSGIMLGIGAGVLTLHSIISKNPTKNVLIPATLVTGGFFGLRDANKKVRALESKSHLSRSRDINYLNETIRSLDIHFSVPYPTTQSILDEFNKLSKELNLLKQQNLQMHEKRILSAKHPLFGYALALENWKLKSILKRTKQVKPPTHGRRVRFNV